MTVPVLPPDDEAALVAALTRGALAESLPEELAVFEAQAGAFLRGETPAGGPGDEVLGFGADVVLLLTPYVVAAATAAVRYVAGVFLDTAKAEATPALAAWIRRVLHRDAAAVPVAGGASAPPAPPAGSPLLTAAMIAEVHQVTLDVCRRMGLDPVDASLVSDAVTGRLAVASA